MEATGLSLAKSALDGLLGYAKSAIADEIALQLGVQREVVFMKNELEMMQTFLMAAEEGRGQEKVVATWVKQVRNLAYDVEDCLREFTVLSEGPFWWFSPRAIGVRHRIAAEIRVLKDRVEEVSQRNLRYRLIGDYGFKLTAAGEQLGISSNAATFGIDEARRGTAQEESPVNLAQLITEGGKARRVVSVWGTSSDFGKTSVIREAYDDRKVFGMFGCRAWVKLMHPFNPTEFLQSLVRQFYGNSLVATGKTQGGTTVGVDVMKRMEMIEAQRHLGDEFDGYVNEKSYLIVLDGLSTIVEWDWIRTYLPDRENGSRIIVSTQQVELAILCLGQPYRVSEIKQLSHDQSIHLFFEEGFEFKSIALTNEIEEDQFNGVSDSDLNVGESLICGRTTAITLEQAQLVGREIEEAQLIQLISKVGEQRLRRVVSIWGMGGIGKTTLARSIYGSQKLSGRFEKHAWITVLHPFNPEEFFRSLAEQLLDKSPGDVKQTLADFGMLGGGMHKLAKMGAEELIKESARLLEGKRYLIVLDDISSIRQWNLIISELHDEKNGSLIIVTTRVASVAKHCSVEDENMYKLESLKDAAALDLLYKKIFKETENFDMGSHMIKEAKLIVKKCGGLPLAIATIGGFLATKPKSVMEWRKLNNHITSELETNPSLEMIKTVLNSSYNGLPHHLKSCFLYLSIFPEARNIRRRRLVRRWIAEGYSRERHGMTTEEIAESYFTDLIDRSMAQPSKTVVGISGTVHLIEVHDLIREIIVSKTTEENLVFALDEHCYLYPQDTVRHLTISSRWKRDKSVFDNMLELSHLRSLTVFGEWQSFFISDVLRLLQVLDLEDTIALRDHDLNQIGKLHHLKYLSLRGCSKIFHLPDSLGNLRHLQTLDVRNTYIMKLPMTIVKLQKLQYLRAGKIPELDDDSSALTEKLLSPWNNFLSYGMHLFGLFSCTRLRGNDPYGVQVPRRIGKLKALNTLGVVHVARGNATIEDLKELTQLQKLGLSGINKKNCYEFCSAIAHHGHLQSLSVRSEVGEAGLVGCLDDVSSPPSNLQSLKLFGNLAILAKWIKHLENLAKLKLCNTQLKQDEIEVLAVLPNLTILRLWNDSFEGRELHFRKTFSALVLLELSRLQYLESVRIERESLPKLELLQVNRCHLLAGEHDIAGLSFLPNLKKIFFDVSDEEVIKRKIRAHAQVIRDAFMFREAARV